MINKLEIREEDLQKLRGKFIIQVNNDDHSPFENQSKGFLLEKRISFISYIDSTKDAEANYVLSGFYYNHRKPMIGKDFVNYINSGGSEDRHFRLLTPKELKILFKWQKQELLNLF